MASNGNLQDWIISQYNSDGDLRLDFTNYAALQGSQGVLINSTASDITVAGTLVPAGKIIYNGETSDIYEIYNAVSNADDILVRGTSGDEWVDLSKTSFDTAEFEWSAGNDYYVPSEQGTGVFTPWNFSASDSVDGSQGLTVDNSSGSLDVTSHQGVFLAEDIGKFYDTQFSDVFLGSEADDAFKLGQGGTDVVTGNGGSDRFRVSSRNQNNSDFSGYSATIADYETLEEISLEDFGFDGTNWEDEYSVAFHSNLDETHISISTQTYDVASVVKIRGEYGLYNSKIEADGDVELYFVAAELLAGVVIDGTDADDKLYGYSGDDTINGLKGDDWLYGGAGNDVIDGGVGFDRIDFRESTSSVVVDFSAGTAAGAAIGSDKISNIERVIGSNFDDTLTGSTTDGDVWESFTGGLGDDIIDGAGGNDYVWYGRSDAGIQVDLETGTVTGGEGEDQLTSIEWVAGSNFADILLGSEGDDGFSPDALGDDGAGSNFKVGGADIIDGKGGVDTVSYNNTGSGGGFSPSGIVASLKVGEVTDQAGNVDKLSNIENITGSAYNDNIVGDTNANSLNGESGDDVLIGGAGDDTLDGGDGDDEIFGGAGDDTLYSSLGADIEDGGEGIDTYIIRETLSYVPVINLKLETAYLKGSDPDYSNSVANMENVKMLGDSAISIIGSDDDNTLNGGAGDDTLDGGDGNDTLRGGAGDDQLVSGLGDDYLYGGDGDDVIVANGGHNEIYAGAGDDEIGFEALNADSNTRGRYISEAGNDHIDLSGASWVDLRFDEMSTTHNTLINFTENDRTIDGVTLGSYSARDQLGYVDTYSGTANGAYFVGTYMDDIAFFDKDFKWAITTGNDELNILKHDLSGILEGDGWNAYDDVGLDWDIGSSTFDYVGEDGQSYTITVNGSLSGLRGSMNADTLRGFAGDDTLSGGAGDDKLDGGAGDDKLDGGAGDDVLNGGAGDDTITGGAGNDTINDGTGDDIIDAGDGIDTYYRDFDKTNPEENWIPHIDLLREGLFSPSFGDDELMGDVLKNFENVELKGSLDSIITGNDADNFLSSDRGDDTITGGAGDDTLDGGAGNDKLYGDAGDDVYEYWGYEGFDVISETSGFDKIIFKDAHTENAGWGSPFQEGDDLVYIADNGISGFRVIDHFSDPDKSIELFEYERSGYSVLIRNSDQEIVDSSGNYGELLVGTVGNDVIIAAAGDNIIHDEIYGYDGDDTIDNSVGGKSWIEAGDGDDVITGGASEDRIRGQDGDDTLSGKDGNDTLFGGAGNDTLDGGAGDDLLNGGSGNDTLSLSADGVYSSKNEAQNATSEFQVGTRELVRLKGKKKISDVIDGGAEVDTVELTDSSDAFFLHDSLSGFHSSLTLVEDYDGRLGTARISNIENINSGLGDDIVDLTSPDYSLVGQNITVDGGSGDDTLWGSDANETLKGGVGDDELFGGAGTNVLTGGAGADEFQFTKTSKNDTVKDFSLSDGDTLKFFNKGGALFDRSSVSLNNAGDELSISDGAEVLSITLEGAGLQMADLGSDVLIIG